MTQSMIVNGKLSRQPTTAVWGGFAAIALLLLAGEEGCRAQDYDVNTLVVYPLHKDVGHADRTQPVAPIVAKKDGGAYIQWAESMGWNKGYRRTAKSLVYVTEISNEGYVVGDDFELGRGQPGGLAAIESESSAFALDARVRSAFAYSLWDDNKLEVDLYASIDDPTIVMDNDLSRGQCRRGEDGLEFLDTKGKPRWGWDIPYYPYSAGRGALVAGKNHVGTIFSHFNCWSNNQNMRLQSDSTLFFDYDDGVGKLFQSEQAGAIYWAGSSAKGQSMDQRMVYDEYGDNFFTISLGDEKGLQLSKYAGETGELQTEGVTPMIFEKGVPYTDRGNKFVDTAYLADEPVWDENSGSFEQVAENRYGLPGNSRGRTSGRLGDLHVISEDRLALTYAAVPQHYSKEYTQQGSQVKKELWTSKNHLVLAFLKGSGKVTMRKIVFEPESKSGQDPYNEYQPYERISWVKSAFTGESIVIFFQTETWKENGPYKRTIDPTYVPQGVQMLQVDLDGNVKGSPITLPSKVGFNLGDGVAVLSNKSLAWTSTKDGELKVNILAPEDQVKYLSDPVFIEDFPLSIEKLSDGDSTSPETRPSDMFNATLENYWSKKCLTGSSTNEKITQQDCNEGNSQRQELSFEEIETTGKYILRFLYSGKCLDVMSERYGEDTKQQTCDPSKSSQQFELHAIEDPTGSGKSETNWIQSMHSQRLSLDVRNFSRWNGGIIQQWKYSGLGQQKWYINVIDSVRRRGLRAAA